MKTIPASANASRKGGVLERKPYPGCTASDRVLRQAAMILSDEIALRSGGRTYGYGCIRHFHVQGVLVGL